jgi:hypothetical protein
VILTWSYLSVESTQLYKPYDETRSDASTQSSKQLLTLEHQHTHTSRIMKFFATLFALPLIGSILASPVPSINQEKRLLGLDLDLGLGGVTESLDLVGLIDRLSAQLVCPPVYTSLGRLRRILTPGPTP